MTSHDDETNAGREGPEGDDFDWNGQAPDELRSELAGRRSGRPGVLTMVLMGLILVAAGFAVGALVGRHSASASTGAAGPGAFPTGGAISGGGGSNGDGFPGGGGFTAGTIEKVQGSTVYLRTTDGSTVKVNTSSSTNVSITKQGALSDLKPGQTVTVIGAQGNSGSIDAARISEGGGFPGGGFPGGGVPGGGGGSPPAPFASP